MQRIMMVGSSILEPHVRFRKPGCEDIVLRISAQASESDLYTSIPGLRWRVVNSDTGSEVVILSTNEGLT